MSDQRYDVVFGDGKADIQPHFCREIEIDAQGEIHECYGENPEHGVSWEEAKAQVIEYYKDVIVRWKRTDESDLFVNENNC